MTGPLAGLRVVELGGDITAPYCTKLLVDLGADVCKIETPVGRCCFGSGGRSARALRVSECRKARNVQSISPLTAVVLHDLIAEADLLVENLPTGTADRWDWGLDRDSLQRINPNLVVVRISDYGQDGPRCDRQSTPLTMQAASGWVNARETLTVPPCSPVHVSLSTSRAVTPRSAP